MKFLQIKKKKKIALTNGACSYGLDEGKTHRERVWRGLELDHRARCCWDSGLGKEAEPHLGSIGMKQNIEFLANLADFLHRLNHSDIVINRHNRNEPRIGNLQTQLQVAHSTTRTGAAQSPTCPTRYPWLSPSCPWGFSRNPRTLASKLSPKP